jgi:hypothetical protein
MFKDFKTRWPTVADWILDGGQLSIHAESTREFRRNRSRSFLNASDPYGFVWNDESRYGTLEETLDAFDDFLKSWLAEMRERPRLQISVLDFIRTGAFGPARLGMKREELETALGRPEGSGCGKSPGYSKAAIWTYGAFEFHFTPDDELWLIFTDHLDEVAYETDRRSHDLDPWILGELGKDIPTRCQVEEALRDEQIAFEEIRETLGRPVLKCRSGVEFLFDPDDAPHLSALSLMSRTS